MATQAQENPLARFDAAALKGIESSSGDAGAPRALFLPTGFGEAMELAKLMAAGLAVPPHLRGKPADCLAVLMQSARWGLDPFAVASKSYFVNDRMAYEAQLVISVLNTSGVLKGRLDFQWDKTDIDLVCTVTGTLKSDPQRPKAIEQGMASIKVKNSPLWAAAPRQQLGYYAARMWARLYAPEVLLGVYTVDEIQEMGIENARQVQEQQPRRRVARAAPVEEQREIVIENQPVEAEVEPVPSEAELEEQAARELDAQTNGWTDGQAAEPAEEQKHAAEPQQEPDWSKTLDVIFNELEAKTTIIDVRSYWLTVEQLLSTAPEGIFNRATGLKNAREAELKAGAK